MQNSENRRLETGLVSSVRTYNMSRNPIRFFCSRYSVIALVGCFIIIPLLGVLLIVFGKFGTTKSWHILVIKTTTYDNINIKVPNYLLVDITSGKEPKCAQMFTKVVPNLQQTNVTDKELIETIVGSSIRGNLNPAYLGVKIEDKSSFLSKGKFCSNKTNEKILFFSSENDENLVDDPIWIESTMKNMTNGLDCTNFDLNKCEALAPEKDQLKLFELNNQILIKRSKRKQNRDSSTLIDYLYVFVRRIAQDYRFGDNQVVKTDFHAFKIIFEKTWVSENRISISINVSNEKPVAKSFLCRVYLRAQTDTKIMPFMGHTAVIFDQLEPSTVYKICADCEKIDPVCVDIQTKSESWSSFKENPAKNKWLRKKHIIYLVISMISFALCMIFFDVKCVIRHHFTGFWSKLKTLRTQLGRICSLFNPKPRPLRTRKFSFPIDSSSSGSTRLGESPVDSRSEISSTNSAILRNQMYNPDFTM